MQFNKSVKKLVGIGLGLALLLGPTLAGAETTASVKIQAILAQIQTLKLQLDTLKAVQTQAVTATTNVSDTLNLIRNIKEGMSGDDVVALQVILASDPNIYPEGIIDGNFSTGTTKALRKFQKKYGIDTLGFAGPKTLKRLNQIIKEIGLSQNSESKNKEDRFCLKLPLRAYVTPGWYNKNGKKKVKIEECRKKFNEFISNPGNGWVSSTTPPAQDVTVPVLSSIATTPRNNGATVTWTTNENATTKVFYSTSSSFDINASTTLSVGTGVFSMLHSANITGLSAVTTYYFVVQSKDPTGNTATSGVGSFTTTAIPDTTAPVLSLVNTSNLLGTTTSITWMTNEAANSKVWFGLTNPLNLLTASLVSDNALTLSHNLSLSGLATSTTYFYTVTSIDASGNTATSSLSSFVTTSGL